MTSYKIKPLENSEYECLVLATSFEDPLDNIAFIELDLKSLGIRGNVLFDMLGQVGNSSERFISILFNGQNFDNKTFSFVAIPKNDMLRKNTLEFFLENLDCLDASILTATDKRLILKGALI